MSDDELADGGKKLFFFQSLEGLFAQKPAHHLTSQTQTKTCSSKDVLTAPSRGHLQFNTKTKLLMLQY